MRNIINELIFYYSPIIDVFYFYLRGETSVFIKV